jgi:hypothetical protein
MVFTCDYNLITDFPNGLETGLLSVEIQNSGTYPSFLFISVADELVQVVFSTDISITPGCIPLSVLIALHNPNTSSVDPEDLATVQVRRTSVAGPYVSNTNVTFDTKDFENFPSLLEKDTVNTERVLIKESGTYRLSYQGTVDTGPVILQLIINGSDTIPGSVRVIDPGTDENHFNCDVAKDLANGDYITCNAISTTSIGTIANLTLLVQRSKASNGEAGPIGPSGPVGAGSGDVLGPGVATDNAIVRFDQVTGTLIQNSGVIIDDTDNVTGITQLSSLLMDVQNSSTGIDGHVRLRTGDDYVSDTYNTGLDTSASNRIIASIEEGTYRQALVLAARSTNATSPIFGLTKSADSGSTWSPVLIATQDCKIGIGKSNPTSALDIIGDIAVSGTVDGVDLGTLGTSLSGHLSDTANPHSVNKTQVGLSNVPNTKMNLSATADPTATDDDASGYTVGSQWLNTTTNTVFTCFDDSTGASVWGSPAAAATPVELETHIVIADDFYGTELSKLWVCNSVGASLNNDVLLVDGLGGVVELTTESVANSMQISTIQKVITKGSGYSLKFRAKLGQTLDCGVEFGSYDDANNYIRFLYDSNISPNILTETRASGVSTQTATTTAANTAWHLFEIRFNDTITFYIDGGLVNTHTTNVPITLFNIYVNIYTITGSLNSLQLDFAQLTGTR